MGGGKRRNKPKRTRKMRVFFLLDFQFLVVLRFEKGNEKIGPGSSSCRWASLFSADYSWDFLAFEMRRSEV